MDTARFARGVAVINGLVKRAEKYSTKRGWIEIARHAREHLMILAGRDEPDDSDGPTVRLDIVDYVELLKDAARGAARQLASD